MDEKKIKKKYVKPQIEEVQLKAEEAVLASCKTGRMAGPVGSARCSQKVGGVRCYGVGQS